ncbi:MAG: acyl-CoA thioesterase [Elusimicrobiota bacterium]
MNSHQFEFRIAYADTDRMGVVYYANYYVLFERGRTELMRSLGVRYRDLEEDMRVFLPAMESSCRYLAPARYDDLIRIRTFVSELGGASITFAYEIENVETGRLLARGSTKHPFVNKDWKPVRVPEKLRSLLAPYLKKE